MRDSQSLSDRETLALAISLEEVYEPIYADFAEGASCASMADQTLSVLDSQIIPKIEQYISNLGPPSDLDNTHYR